MPVLSEFAAAMLGVDASGARDCANADVVHKTKNKVANKRMGPHWLALINSPSIHTLSMKALKYLARGRFHRDPDAA